MTSKQHRHVFGSWVKAGVFKGRVCKLHTERPQMHHLSHSFYLTLGERQGAPHCQENSQTVFRKCEVNYHNEAQYNYKLKRT